MRISDWSSDVCSSDLRVLHRSGARAGFDQTVRIAGKGPCTKNWVPKTGSRKADSLHPATSGKIDQTDRFLIRQARHREQEGQPSWRSSSEAGPSAQRTTPFAQQCRDRKRDLEGKRGYVSVD